MIKPHIEIEGLKEMQADLRKAQGKLPAALGQAHKNVGNFVISKLPPADPNAVGAGTGAMPRPSATKRDVVIRVGTGAREAAKNQWGKTPVQPFVGGRPYIIGTVEANQNAIIWEFKKQLLEAVGPAVFSVS